MKKLLALFVVVLGFSAVSFGQTTATATSSASATILAPLAISNTLPLNFGTIGASATTSTVTLAADNSRVVTGGATALGVGAPARAGVFAISGTPNALFTVVLPTTTISLTGPGVAMTILPADWSQDLGANPALSALGAATLKVGAKLNVGAAQLAGNYTATYPVTVNYN